MPSGLGAGCTVESRRKGEASEATREGPEKQKAHEPKFVGFLEILGRPCGIRTCDQRIKSPLLYQLS